MKLLAFIPVFALSTLLNAQVSKPELVIGEERLEPGIVFVFEGAIKDHNTRVNPFVRKRNKYSY